MSLLLLNTVLAEGSFALDSLRERHTALSRQAEALKQDVAYKSSPQVLERKARALGMKPSTTPIFLDIRTGRVYGPAHRGPGEQAGSTQGAAEAGR